MSTVCCKQQRTQMYLLGILVHVHIINSLICIRWVYVGRYTVLYYMAYVTYIYSVYFSVSFNECTPLISCSTLASHHFVCVLQSSLVSLPRTMLPTSRFQCFTSSAKTALSPLMGESTASSLLRVRMYMCMNM